MLQSILHKKYLVFIDSVDNKNCLKAFNKFAALVLLEDT